MNFFFSYLSGRSFNAELNISGVLSVPCGNVLASSSTYFSSGNFSSSESTYKVINNKKKHLQKFWYHWIASFPKIELASTIVLIGYQSYFLNRRLAQYILFNENVQNFLAIFKNKISQNFKRCWMKAYDFFLQI